PSSGCAGTTVGCIPVSGYSFPVGVTTVTCTARNAAGDLQSTCSFHVTVRDCEPPHITCPEPVPACTDSGRCDAVVTYQTPPGTDNCGGTVNVSCTPASGSTFPLGPTTVTCTATDGANPANQATCQFTV